MRELVLLAGMGCSFAAARELEITRRFENSNLKEFNLEPLPMQRPSAFRGTRNKSDRKRNRANRWR